MKKIDISQIVSPTSKQPFTANSLKFKQDYDVENYSALVKALITQSTGSYSLTTPYVISGCVLSDSNKDVTAGEIFYGGNFYNVTALNGTTNIVQFILTKTYDPTADPLTFTDGVVKNVHEIYTYVSTDVASGGDFDATDLVSLYVGKIAEQKTLATQTTSSGTYVNLTDLDYTTPADGITRKYKLSFIGNAEISAASGTSVAARSKFQIYNVTDATSLDVKTIETAVIVTSGTTDVYGTFPINCATIVSLAPSKEIRCRFLNETDGVTVTECKFLIEEI